ncbi:MAG: hypothetical protein U0166_20120 [Acidobacteriota bacterium]
MLRVRLRVAPASPGLPYGLLVLLVLSVLCLALGPLRIALVPAFGVTWNVVPGILFLLAATLYYAKPWDEEPFAEPVVGYPALLLLLPVAVLPFGYGPSAGYGLVGHDLSLLGDAARGSREGLGLLPRLVLAWVPFSVRALLYASLVVHIGCSWLVGLLALRITRDRTVALLAAILFSVFPLTVEAVAWVTGERMLEGCFLTLGSILLAAFSRSVEGPTLLRATGSTALRHSRELWRQARRARALWIAAQAASLALLALAMRASHVAIAAPFAIVVIDLLDSGGLSHRVSPWRALRMSLRHTIPPFVVAAAMLVASPFPALPSPGPPLLRVMANTLTFARDLVIPLSQAHYHDQPLIILIGVLLVIELVVIGLVKGRPEAPVLRAVLLLVMALALPALPFLTPDESPSGGRFLYLASAAYVILGSVYMRGALRVHRESGRWLLMGLAIGVSVVCLRFNMQTWAKTARVTILLTDTLARFSEVLPRGTAIVLLDWPEEVDGVPFAGPRDLEAAIELRRTLTGKPEGPVRVYGPGAPDLPGARRFRWNPQAHWVDEVPGAVSPPTPDH